MRRLTSRSLVWLARTYPRVPVFHRLGRLRGRVGAAAGYPTWCGQRTYGGEPPELYPVGTALELRFVLPIGRPCRVCWPDGLPEVRR